MQYLLKKDMKMVEQKRTEAKNNIFNEKFSHAIFVIDSEQLEIVF